MKANRERVNKQANQSPYVKDAFHNYVIHRCAAAVNPQNVGSKAAAYYQLTIPAVKNQTVRLRLAETDPDSLQADRDGNPIGGSFDHFRGRSAWHPGPLASLKSPSERQLRNQNPRDHENRWLRKRKKSREWSSLLRSFAIWLLQWISQRRDR